MGTNDNLIPFGIIEAATEGDIEAINFVLKYYARYINTLATQTSYDENNNLQRHIDMDIKRRLETKLITKILCFNVTC